MPAEVRAAADAADDHVGLVAGQLHLAIASWPITVWCSSTWLSTEPSA